MTRIGRNGIAHTFHVNKTVRTVENREASIGQNSLAFKRIDGQPLNQSELEKMLGGVPCKVLLLSPDIQVPAGTGRIFRRRLDCRSAVQSAAITAIESAAKIESATIEVASGGKSEN